MSDDIKKPTPIIVSLDPVAEKLYKAEIEHEKLVSEGKAPKNIVYSILDDLSKSQSSQLVPPQAQRLSFTADPTRKDVYDGIYQNRPYLLPYALTKRIHRTDDLIAAILNMRSNWMSSFGRPRASRLDVGFDIVVHKQILETIDDDAKNDLLKRIDRAKKVLYQCGTDKPTPGKRQRLTLPQYLKMITLDGLRFGRCATEIIKSDDSDDVWFVPVDAGTIYRVAPHSQEAAQRLREASKKLLEDISDGKFDDAKFQNMLKSWEDSQYAWIQVFDNRQLQAFTEEQLIVHNFYPITDVEYNGYPLTPLDTIINAVTCHINITQHNRLYFQSGRATRGMLVINSDSITRDVVNDIKIQFNASINSVQNSWRMPVLGVGSDSTINWIPLDASGHRDAEFQLLSDANARTILAAFQISPDELPGYAHLSRATNQQSLSESNNQYKLAAARDVGARPLLLTIQDMLNSAILPVIDKQLSEYASIVLAGLDAEDPLKELGRLQAEMGVHATYNDILETVDKKCLPAQVGADLPLNPQYQAVLEKYLTVGQILEYFFDMKGAAQAEQYSYIRDPLWLQWQQVQIQAKQLEIQAQQIQMQAQQQQQAMDMAQQQSAQAQMQQPDMEGGSVPEVGATPSAAEDQQDLTGVVDQLIGLLEKSEKQLPQNRKRLIAQQRAAVFKTMTQWEKESEAFLRDILKEVERHSNHHEPKAHPASKANKKE